MTTALALLLLIVWAHSLPRPIFDYWSDYRPVDHIVDMTSGLVVELGWVWDISSGLHEVSVYREFDPDRPMRETNPPLITVMEGVSEEKLHFDGECYFLRAAIVRKEWDRVIPSYFDPATRNTLCFYVETPMGKVIRMPE